MMMIGPRRFFFIVCSNIVLLFAAYYGCIFLQEGSPVQAEWWVKDIFQYKDILAGNTKSPKIIIAGGSNCLFGIHSETLNKTTGYNIINLAGHAGLDIDFYYYKIKEHMSSGDIIILPLEFEYYKINKTTDWFINNMLAWGWNDYLRKIGFIDWAKFIYHVPPKRIFSGIKVMNKPNPLAKEEVIVQTVANQREASWKGYSYRSLNSSGDITVHAGPTREATKISKKGFNYINNIKITDHFLQFYNKTAELAVQRNGRIILTWPVSIKNQKFNLAEQVHRNRIREFASQLSAHSIPIYCAPEAFNLDVQYFFNTKYHLNKSGSLLRSQRLGECVNEILEKNSDSP